MESYREKVGEEVAGEDLHGCGEPRNSGPAVGVASAGQPVRSKQDLYESENTNTPHQDRTRSNLHRLNNPVCGPLPLN